MKRRPGMAGYKTRHLGCGRGGDCLLVHRVQISPLPLIQKAQNVFSQGAERPSHTERSRAEGVQTLEIYLIEKARVHSQTALSIIYQLP
jgi:hypothetical protein